MRLPNDKSATTASRSAWLTNPAAVSLAPELIRS
jgi:hypothetical protein